MAVDPGPEGKVAGVGDLHVWSVMVGGLGPQEKVFLHDSSGRVVATATANQNAYVQLDALSTPSPAGLDVMLSRDGKVMSEAEYAKHAAEIMRRGETGPGREVLLTIQTQLNRIANLPLGSEARALTVAQRHGEAQLLAVTEKGLSIYGLRSGVPELREQQSIPGLCGVLQLRGRLLAFGEFGIRDVADAETALPVQAQILDATMLNDRLLVLHQDALLVYSTEFQLQGTLALRSARSLCTAGSLAVVHTAEQLVAYDLERPNKLAPHGTRPIKGYSIVKVVQGPKRRSVFVRDGKGGGSLLDLSVPGRAEVQVMYDVEPWFLEAAGPGAMVARIGPDHGTAEVYRVTGICRTGFRTNECGCGQEKQLVSEKSRFIPPNRES